jgi:hypothetical protein
LLFGGGKSKGRIKFLLLLLLLRKKTGVNKFLVSSFLQQMGGFARSVLFSFTNETYTRTIALFLFFFFNQVRWSDDGATESVPPWNSPAAGGITAMCTNPLRPLLAPWCYGTFRFSFSFHGVLKKDPSAHVV